MFQCFRSLFIKELNTVGLQRRVLLLLIFVQLTLELVFYISLFFSAVRLATETSNCSCSGQLRQIFKSTVAHKSTIARNLECAQCVDWSWRAVVTFDCFTNV